VSIIAIETATLVCGTAIVRDGAILAEEFIEQKNAHAESIMFLIQRVLSTTGSRLNDVDAVAVSIGPGSFTGLRIGLSTAKGLCYALDKPLVAVPTLTGLAHRAMQSGKITSPFLLAAIDARRDEVYCQLFRVNGKSLESEWDQQDLSIGELAGRLSGLSVSVTGDARQKIVANEQMKMLHVVDDEFAVCRAGVIALLGEELAQQGEFIDPILAEPTYIKAFHTLVS
jgi:tRNA threonylcarbamoyladenosine biosynthesis protein TsaB